MTQAVRGLPLWIALLVGMLGVGMSLASVASAQDSVPVAMEAVDEADAGDSAISGASDIEYTINTLIMFICAVLVIFM